MNALLLALFVAAPSNLRPTIAVLPPVAIDGAESWLGLAVADNLANSLLRFTRPTAKGAGPEFPLNVFSWREVLSAARSEDLDVSRPLSNESVHKLARELGARYIFSGSYRIKRKPSPKVLLKWRLIDIESPKPARDFNVTTNLATLSRRTGLLEQAVLKAVGERVDKKKPAAAAVPTKALQSYGEGLLILAKQSLEPHARIVVSVTELTKARALFEDAVRRAPNFLRAQISAAIACSMMGETDAAEQQILRAFTKASQFEPLNAIGLYYLFMRRSQSEQATKTLAETVANNPGFLGALGYLGNGYLRDGQARKAVEVSTAYEQKVPKSPWARIMHGRALAYAGQIEEGLKETSEVLSEFPDSSAVVAALAARQTQAGQYAEAIKILEKALVTHPDHPVLLTRLSYAQLQLGHAEIAVDLAKRAVARLNVGRGEMTIGYAYADLGQALAMLGKKEEAGVALRKAAELGINSEARLQLLADERAMKVAAEAGAKAALVDDRPPAPAAAPAPAVPAPAPVASAPPAAAAAASPSPALPATAAEAGNVPASERPASPVAAGTPSATGDAGTAAEPSGDAADSAESDEDWSEEDNWEDDEEWEEADYDDQPDADTVWSESTPMPASTPPASAVSATPAAAAPAASTATPAPGSRKETVISTPTSLRP